MSRFVYLKREPARVFNDLRTCVLFFRKWLFFRRGCNPLNDILHLQNFRQSHLLSVEFRSTLMWFHFRVIRLFTAPTTFQLFLAKISDFFLLLTQLKLSSPLNLRLHQQLFLAYSLFGCYAIRCKSKLHRNGSNAINLSGDDTGRKMHFPAREWKTMENSLSRDEEIGKILSFLFEAHGQLSERAMNRSIYQWIDRSSRKAERSMAKNIWISYEHQRLWVYSTK